MDCADVETNINALVDILSNTYMDDAEFNEYLCQAIERKGYKNLALLTKKLCENCAKITKK